MPKGFKFVCEHDPVNGCAECRAARKKQWARATRERHGHKYDAARKTWRAANSGSIKESYKDWLSRNPDYHKHYYARNKEHYSQLGRTWRAINKIEDRETRRRADGMVYAVGQSYRSLLEAQQNRCKICLRDLSELPGHQVHVDHDHSVVDAPNVRGVLCARCNGGLGMFCDNTATMLAAMVYLVEWRYR